MSEDEKTKILFVEKTCEDAYRERVPMLEGTSWLDVAIWFSFGGAIVLFFIAAVIV